MNSLVIQSPNVYLLGDIHAGWQNTERLILNTPDHSAIIQLGDFGFDPRGNFGVPWPPTWDLGNRTVFFIPGNHEDHDALPLTIEEVSPGVLCLPGACLLSVNGVSVLTVAGADTPSFDRARREWGKTIFSNEGVSPESVEDALRTLEPGEVPLFLTHCAPRQVALPGIRRDTYEDSRNQLSYLIPLLPEYWVFGHYHMSEVGHFPLPVEGEVNEIPICRWLALRVNELFEVTQTLQKLLDKRNGM